jgi:hypothetical protein
VVVSVVLPREFELCHMTTFWTEPRSAGMVC